ncbi:MAG: hypothetical protein AB9873_17475 [Syntrophobacteraceae bacterium]
MIRAQGVSTDSMIILGVGLVAICGSLVYRISIAVALSTQVGFLRLTPSDLNLITAILVVICLTYPLMRDRWNARRRMV